MPDAPPPQVGLDHAATRRAAVEAIRATGAGDARLGAEPIAERLDLGDAVSPHDEYTFLIGMDGRVYGRGESPPPGKTWRLQIDISGAGAVWEANALIIDTTTDPPEARASGSNTVAPVDPLAAPDERVRRDALFRPTDAARAVRHAVRDLQAQGYLDDPAAHQHVPLPHANEQLDAWRRRFDQLRYRVDHLFDGSGAEVTMGVAFARAGVSTENDYFTTWWCGDVSEAWGAAHRSLCDPIAAALSGASTVFHAQGYATRKQLRRIATGMALWERALTAVEGALDAFVGGYVAWGALAEGLEHARALDGPARAAAEAELHARQQRVGLPRLRAAVDAAARPVAFPAITPDDAPPPALPDDVDDEDAPLTIVAVLVDEDQHARSRSAKARYRRGALPRTRLLWLIGENFARGEGRQVLSEDEDVRYSPGTDAPLEGRPPLVPIDPELLARLEALHGRSLDVRPLFVEVTASATPGGKRFRWADAEGRWTLGFGDAVDVRIVRAASGGWEAIDTVFAPEDIAIEVRPAEDRRAPLGLASIATELRIGARSPQAMVAARVAVTDVYRTPPIRIAIDPAPAPRPGTTAALVAIGDALTAELAEPVLAMLSGGRAIIEGRPERGSRWKDALARAARCAGIEVTDWQVLPARPSTRLADATIVTAGAHAALLLVRDELLATLERAATFYRALRDQPERLPAFRRDLADGLNADSPLWYLPLDDALGGLPLSVAIGDYAQACRSHPALFVPAAPRFAAADEMDFDRWAIEGLGRAVNEMCSAVETSLALVRGTDDCDVEALVRLASGGLELVVERVAARLMRFDDATGAWSADVIARSHVRGVSALVDAVRAQWQHGDAALTVLVLGLSCFGVPGLVLAAGIAFVDALCAFLKSGWSKRLALGGSVVFGRRRYEEAQLEHSQRLAALVGASVGLGLAGCAPFLWRVTQRAVQLLLPQIERGAAAAMQSLSELQLRRLLAFVADAEAAERAGAPLTALQRRCLDVTRRAVAAAPARVAPPRAPIDIRDLPLLPDRGVPVPGARAFATIDLPDGAGVVIASDGTGAVVRPGSQIDDLVHLVDRAAAHRPGATAVVLPETTVVVHDSGPLVESMTPPALLEPLRAAARRNGLAVVFGLRRVPATNAAYEGYGISFSRTGEMSSVADDIHNMGGRPVGGVIELDGERCVLGVCQDAPVGLSPDQLHIVLARASSWSLAPRVGLRGVAANIEGKWYSGTSGIRTVWVPPPRPPPP